MIIIMTMCCCNASHKDADDDDVDDFPSKRGSAIGTVWDLDDEKWKVRIKMFRLT